MSQQGVALDYTYKITGPDGTDHYVSAYKYGDPVPVSNYSTSNPIGALEAVIMDTTNSVVPSTPLATSSLLSTPIYGNVTPASTSTSLNFLGVAAQTIPVKDTTKPIGRYTGMLFGIGSICFVRSIQSLTSSTLGNFVVGSSTLACVDAKTSMATAGAILGQMVKAQVSGTWVDGSGASVTAYFIGVYISPR